jgi:hypothetical protein
METNGVKLSEINIFMDHIVFQSVMEHMYNGGAI